VIASILAGLISLVFLLWIVLRIDGARATDGVDDIGELIAALCAALVCGVAAQRVSVGRRSWALLAASSLSWAIGEALWSYYDLIKGVQVPFPSLADAGFLAAIPLACAGLLLFPSSHQSASHRVQGLLDGCIIATAVLFASWVTILGPLYRSHQGSGLKQVFSLAYPMSDVVMVSLVVILIARAGRREWISLGMVMTGIVAFAIADSSFAYLTEVNKLWKRERSRHGLGRRIPLDRSGCIVGDDGTLASDRTERGPHALVAGVVPSGARGVGSHVDPADAGGPYRAGYLDYGLCACSPRPCARGPACVGSVEGFEEIRRPRPGDRQRGTGI
jgi:hypothetical protein